MDDDDTKKFCNVCGLPLTEAMYGTNADGSKNMQFCRFCYQNGKETKIVEKIIKMSNNEIDKIAEETT